MDRVRERGYIPAILEAIETAEDLDSLARDVHAYMKAFTGMNHPAAVGR
ncbi:MAG: hypothetical protein SWH68_05975 [Thermodesulfobacteriota bacterium]|nr:hypothetical protein [Thermodesulfobacteriota bacterium]